MTRTIRIGIVAPGGRIEPELPARLADFAAAQFPQAELVFHPQCTAADGPFAGSDHARAEAFLDIANDASFDALWWARGGYGANRIATLVWPHLKEAARAKTYLGYSDAGFLLAMLYRRGLPFLAHGPVARDILRAGGEAAAARALGFLTTRNRARLGRYLLEPHVGRDDAPAVAFNLCVLSHLIGTDLMPSLSGHVLMVEEVSEALYRIDREFFHVTAALRDAGLAGLRMGRANDVTPNDPAFGKSADEIARHWCERSGIAYLGAADIGHDIDNKIVPFGKWPWK